MTYAVRIGIGKLRNPHTVTTYSKRGLTIHVIGDNMTDKEESVPSTSSSTHAPRIIIENTEENTEKENGT